MSTAIFVVVAAGVGLVSGALALAIVLLLKAWLDWRHW